MNLPPEPVPTLPYAPEAEGGDLLVRWHDGGLTVLVPPVGWTRKLAAPLVAAGALLFLAGACSVVVWRGWAQSPVLYAVYAGTVLFGAAGLYTAAYAYHLSARRVRIDVDARQLRRSLEGPFLRSESAWDRREIAGLIDVEEQTNRRDAADPAFYLLYLRTRDGRQHVLCDSPDVDELRRISAVLAAALDE